MKPTSAQQRAIDSNAPHILCCASPGSGKTGTAAKRVLRLVRDGVSPDDIAAICYTNDASAEFNRRLHPESGEYAINLGFCGTEHSFALRHLQEFRGMANVTVLDDNEANEELLRCSKQAGVKATERELTKCRENWTVESTLPKTAVRIAVGSYYRRMAGSHALDYNAILTSALADLMSGSPGLKSLNHQRHWKHLIVDESQDHSALDFAIFNAVSAENRFYVGDPDQSSFGFRGADPHIIVQLSKNPKWETILLEGNFRSTQEICDAAQRLIEHNTNRVQKRLISMRPWCEIGDVPSPPREVAEMLARRDKL